MGFRARTRRGLQPAVWGLLLAICVIAPASVFAEDQSKSIPSEFLADAKPLRIDLGFFEQLKPSNKATMHTLPLEGMNTTASPIALGSTTIGPLRRSGDVETSVATVTPFYFDPNTCVGRVDRGKGCTMTLNIPGDIGPGDYNIDVALQGLDEGQSRRTLNIEVRASAWFAGILIALGVALGVTIADWRSLGRPATDRRIKAADIRAQAQTLSTAATNGPVQAQASELARELVRLDARLVDGEDLGSRLTEASERLEKLGQAEQVLVAAEKADPPLDVFGTLTAKLVSALDAADWAGITSALSALRGELAQFPLLVDAARRLDVEIERLREAMAAIRADKPDLASIWDRARAERIAAFTRITGETPGQASARTGKLDTTTASLTNMIGGVADSLFTAVAARIKEALAAEASETARKLSLDALTAKLQTALTRAALPAERLEDAKNLWRQLRDLLRPTTEAKTTGLEGTASEAIARILPDDNDLKLSLGANFFQSSVGASAAELRASRKGWDVFTEGGMLAVTAAVGVLALWVPNHSWGSIYDVLGAVLAGVATRLTIGNIAIPGR